jgi:hypothetical protein
MCNDDFDFEDFVKKNKEKIEKILKEENEGKDPSDDYTVHDGSEDNDCFGGKFPFKLDLGPFEKIGDAFKEVVSLLLEPKVQIHFIRAGKELFSGIEEMIKSAPIPEEMKEMMDKAHKVKDKIVEDLAEEFDPEAKKEKKPKGKKMKKIDVE